MKADLHRLSADGWEEDHGTGVDYMAGSCGGQRRGLLAVRIQRPPHMSQGQCSMRGAIPRDSRVDKCLEMEALSGPVLSAGYAASAQPTAAGGGRQSVTARLFLIAQQRGTGIRVVWWALVGRGTKRYMLSRHRYAAFVNVGRI
jgi:hypothetical protein